MKRRSRIILVTVGFCVVAGGGAAAAGVGSGKKDDGPSAVKVARADVVDRALAVGTIEPEVSVSVKAKVSGVVSRAFAEAGDQVTAGSALLEIRPDATPLELIEGRRDVEMREIELENLKKDVERQQALFDRGLISQQDLELARRHFEESALQVKTAKEKLQLLEVGRSAGVESVVRAPITGSILEKTVETGDPVVPLTTYQEGTVLMTMADMSHLLFKGTVDEIDVGRLKEGMPVEIKIGALPDAKLTGRVSRISLKAKKEDNATTFPIEIALDPSRDVTLRAGLSANAEVVVKQRRQVLVVPERLVTFEKDGKAWVTVRKADGSTEKREIRTGLSDAIQVEVLSGLKEGEQVLEKPTQEIK
jgi:HlyD family secretion protein